MIISDKKKELGINKNFRNNQNYIIGNLDKKFIIYNFFEKKKSYILQIIVLLAIAIFPVISLLFYTLSIKLDSIINIILILFGIFGLFSILFGIYMLMILINYRYTMKFIRQLKYKFYKKPTGILLKNNPNGKYKEIFHYFTIGHDTNDLREGKKDIAKDFTYIYK